MFSVVCFCWWCQWYGYKRKKLHHNIIRSKITTVR